MFSGLPLWRPSLRNKPNFMTFSENFLQGFYYKQNNFSHVPRVLGAGTSLTYSSGRSTISNEGVQITVTQYRWHAIIVNLPPNRVSDTHTSTALLQVK